MPVLARHSAVLEMSNQISTLHLEGDEDRIDRNDEPRLGPAVSLIEEIIELRDKIESYEKERAEAIKSTEQMKPVILEAQEALLKAQEKKEALIKKGQLLEVKLQDLDRRIEKSTKYWQTYGLSVKQVSKDDDSYEQYEFTFTNLKRKSKRSNEPPSGEPTTGGDTNPSPTDVNGQKEQQEQTRTKCSIQLRFQDKKLEIVDQIPEILSAEELSLLNDKLTHHCVNQEDCTVNYKSAMTLIGKDLKRSLCPSPRTCSHLPTETNSHTCT